MNVQIPRAQQSFTLSAPTPMTPAKKSPGTMDTRSFSRRNYSRFQSLRLHHFHIQLYTQPRLLRYGQASIDNRF